jgi:hypothetical protein
MTHTKETLKLALEALEPLTLNAELRGDNLPEGNEIQKMADAGFKAIAAIKQDLAAPALRPENGSGIENDKLSANARRLKPDDTEGGEA